MATGRIKVNMTPSHAEPSAEPRPSAEKESGKPVAVPLDTVVVDCDECGRETRLFAVRRPAGLFWRGSAELDETFDIYDSALCGGCGGSLSARAEAAYAVALRERTFDLYWCACGWRGLARMARPVCGGCGGPLAARAAAAHTARACGLGWLLAGSYGFARGLGALVVRVARVG